MPNWLSVFDHFVVLALKGLSKFLGELVAFKMKDIATFYKRQPSSAPGSGMSGRGLEHKGMFKVARVKFMKFSEKRQETRKNSGH